MKKLFCLLLTFCLLLSLAGCGGAPAESTPVESTPVESTPQQAAVPCPPWGIQIDALTLGETGDYQTICYQDTSLATVGHVQIAEYTIEQTDDPGRVNKTLKLKFTFDDENAWNNGMKYGVVFAGMGDETFEEGDDGEDVISIVHKGKEDEIRILRDEFLGGDWWGEVFLNEYVLTLNMPADYNDFALMAVDYGKALPLMDEEGNYISGFAMTELTHPDTPWFRFDDKGSSGDAPDEEGIGFTPAGPMERMVEISDWNAELLDPNGATEVVFQVAACMTLEGDRLMSRAYYGDEADPFIQVATPVPGNMDYCGEAITFRVDGNDTDADFVVFEFSLQDADGYEDGFSTVSIPFAGSEDTQGPAAGGDGPVILVEGPEEVYDGFDVDLTVQGWSAGDRLWALVYEPGSSYNLFEVDNDLEYDENSFGFAIDRGEMTGDTLIFEFVVTDSTGRELCCETRTVVWK